MLKRGDYAPQCVRMGPGITSGWKRGSRDPHTQPAYIIHSAIETQICCKCFVPRGYQSDPIVQHDVAVLTLRVESVES